MKPDALKDAFTSVGEGLAALSSLSVLLCDARHSQTQLQEVGQVLAFFGSSLEQRVEIIEQAFMRDVLPFYRDFQSAQEAIRGKVKA
ncbi:hypothetical protein K6V92_00335 [Cupriavidus respiraculi]|uniref:hypothetical protein n=1 Tax=Cupriavidus respiraculi TaxID=195930 RepID=UPI001C960277|nr:hypothetical protein [Cupriavidus respiraculi]MBY4945071.1 hypothetical protein [Cupriavidus respiraculi]